LRHRGYWGLCPQAPGVYPPEDTGEVGKAADFYSAALHRLSAAASGRSTALPCLAAFLVLSGLLWIFTFTQFSFQTLTDRSGRSPTLPYPVYQ